MSYKINIDGDIVVDLNENDQVKKATANKFSYSNDNLISDDSKTDWTLSSLKSSHKRTRARNPSITNNTHGDALGYDAVGNLGTNNDVESYRNYNSPFLEDAVIQDEDLDKADTFSSRYQLDGLQGLYIVNRLNEGESTEIADGALIYFNLLGRMLIINSILNVVLNVSTRIPEDKKQMLGSYKNKNVDYIVKYLSERYNYPVDLYKKSGNFFASSFGIGEENESAIMTTNIAFMIGLNEFLFPGNGFSKELDNIIHKEYVESRVENKFYDFMNTMLNSGIEYLSSEEESRNRLKLLLRKLEMSYDFNKKLNELEKNNFDIVVKFLFEQVFDNYAFKFLIERINVGLKLYERKHEENAPFEQPKHVLTTQINANIGNTAVKSPEDKSYRKKEYILGSKIDDKIPTSIAYTNSALLLNNSAKVYSSNKNASDNKNFIQTEYNRLSQTVVSYIEDVIDTDYMPFSIHDLRTNEVIGFNAFIESYSDSFSAQYNEAGGFGRVDKVMKWESTTRSISVNFYIIATNEEDHDMMWYQINKLVTMLYPQWSPPSGVVYFSDTAELKAGLKTDDDARSLKGYEAFRYPFTQVPTASPLVRIRLGDILTTNYSDVNIKRIHGLGDRSKTEDANNVFKTDNDIRKDITVEYYSYRLKPGKYGLLTHNSNFDEAKIKIATVDDNGKIYFDNNNSFDYKLHLNETNKINIKEYTKITVSKGADTEIYYIKSLTLDNLIVKVSGEVPLDIRSKLRSGQLNNPITAGFATTMGRGLAGMISSLSVDFSGELPWDIRMGSRAPIYTKITMQFKPIHDIAPGLDHNGMMRAPVYRVGNIVKGLS